MRENYHHKTLEKAADNLQHLSQLNFIAIRLLSSIFPFAFVSSSVGVGGGSSVGASKSSEGLHCHLNLPLGATQVIPSLSKVLVKKTEILWLLGRKA